MVAVAVVVAVATAATTTTGIAAERAKMAAMVDPQHQKVLKDLVNA